MYLACRAGAHGNGQICQGWHEVQPTISVAFVWLLTKQTGSNVGAGLGSKLPKLEERLKSVESTAKEAIKEANEATKRAALAGTNTGAVKLGLDYSCL